MYVDPLGRSTIQFRGLPRVCVIWGGRHRASSAVIATSEVLSSPNLRETACRCVALASKRTEVNRLRYRDAYGHDRGAMDVGESGGSAQSLRAELSLVRRVRS